MNIEAGDPAGLRRARRSGAVARAILAIAGSVIAINKSAGHAAGDSLLEDTPGVVAEIARLMGEGLHFAVDDMGAGYSGLRQITTVRPTYLKLDRSLISGIDADPDRGALVSAMLSYVRQTGGHLIAEGVETEAELQTLRRLGVTLIQGYLLGRPAPPWPMVGLPTAAPTISLQHAQA